MLPTSVRRYQKRFQCLSEAVSGSVEMSANDFIPVGQLQRPPFGRRCLAGTTVRRQMMDRRFCCVVLIWWKLVDKSILHVGSDTGTSYGLQAGLKFYLIIPKAVSYTHLTLPTNREV